MNCGREPGGANVDEFGICPAAVDVRYDGVNGGDCAGRCCWFVFGTYCNSEVQGTFAKKIGDCLDCPFFVEVGKQEGMRMAFTIDDVNWPAKCKP